MVHILPTVIATILFPKLSAMPNIREKWDFSKSTTLWVGSMMAIVTSCAALLANPLVGLLFGKAFIPAVPAFMWLLPGIFMLSINTIYMNYFASIGMPSVTVYSSGIAAIVNILLNLRLIPWLGIVGASTASVLSYGLMLGISLVHILSSKRYS